ncbi:MAG: DUF192 domain-containing protein [Acidobacteria bacterium]|nr:DUF192 domain-containing protein [Acidobacteriota bacterium]MDA1234876.1 DUF192 domain-containing protein [Acidobacteriota bacterium]
MIVRNTTKGTELGDNVSLAGTGKTRNKGLLGRDGLDAGEGLWIRPCEAIHMFFMRFAIDAVFIDKKKRVTKIAANLKPWRLSASLRAHSVVELPAGTAQRTNTERGDQLEIVEA